MFSTFSPTTPSLFLDVDRDKAQALGVPISDIFSALQASLGGFYVNDFNLFGRTWQVNIQAEAEDRDDIPDIWRIRVRTNRGEMVPLRAFADIRIVVGPQTIQRYNNFRSAHHQRRAAAGRLLGRRAGGDGGALGARAAARLRLSNGPAPPTRRSWRPGRPIYVVALAVLFAYLFLVALYESWTIPIPVLLSVVVGGLGSFLAILIAGLSASTSTRRSGWWC